MSPFGPKQCTTCVVRVVQVKMPVARALGFSNHPSLVKCLDNLLWQRSLLQIQKVRLQLIEAANSNDDAVVSALDLQRGVVHHPPQSRLDKAEVVLLNHRLNHSKRIKGRVLEIPLSIHLAHFAYAIAVPAFRGYVAGLVFAAEEAAGKRVIDDNVKTVPATGRDEFWLNSTGCSGKLSALGSSQVNLIGDELMALYMA